MGKKSGIYERLGRVIRVADRVKTPALIVVAITFLWVAFSVGHFDIGDGEKGEVWGLINWTLGGGVLGVLFIIFAFTRDKRLFTGVYTGNLKERIFAALFVNLLFLILFSVSGAIFGALLWIVFKYGLLWGPLS